LNKKMVHVQQNGKWGILDRNLNVFVPVEYDERFNYETYRNETIAKKNGKYGIVNYKNGLKTTLPFQYDKIYSSSSEDFMVVKQNNKFGMVAYKTGEIKITCQYDSLNISFFENHIEALKNDKWGIINIKNEVQIPFEYNGFWKSKNSREDLLVYKKNNKKGVIGLGSNDYRTAFKTDALFDDVPLDRGFSNSGIFKAEIGGRYFLYNQSKQMFEVGKNDEIFIGSYQYSGQKLLNLSIRINNKTGYFDCTENTLAVPFAFEEVVRIDNSQTFFSVGQKEPNSSSVFYALYDAKSKKNITDYLFKYIGDLGKDGYFSAKTKSENAVIIDKDGHILDKGYEDIADYDWGSMRRVKRNGKYGYLNNKLEEIIAPQFSDASAFNGEFAHVKMDTKHYSIDKTGKLSQINYEVLDNWYSDFLVTKDGKKGIVNEVGSIRIPIEYESISNHGWCASCRMFRAIVGRNKKYGAYYNETMIIPVEYDNIIYGNGKFTAMKNGKSYAFDSETAKCLEGCQ
jgi:WG containing repeat